MKRRMNFDGSLRLAASVIKLTIVLIFTAFSQQIAAQQGSDCLL